MFFFFFLQLGALFLGKTIGGVSAEVDSSKENGGEMSLSDESEDSGDRHLFSGLSFRIMVNDEEMYQRLYCYIDARGGMFFFHLNVKVLVTISVTYVVGRTTRKRRKCLVCVELVTF